ncbi:MAG: hypothetical protein H8D43_01655 [Chloroflexi bacterium]|nr:hypothetical protein [Chloroflexota bacterium]
MIKIDIGDICVGLKLDDAEITQSIIARYADFVSPTGRPEVVIQVEVQEEAQFIPIIPGVPQVIEFSFQNDKLTIEYNFGAGSVDMTLCEGNLAISPEGYVENFLRVLYSWLCTYHNAVLIHSAGVIRDGKALAFFGHSGSGKSTTALLSLNHIVLSDDMVIVKKTGNTYKACGTPFYGGGGPETPRTNACAELRAMFRLRKDVEHFVKSLDRSQALAEVISCVPFVVKEVAMAQRVMEICTDLVMTVPVKELHFRRDKDFWKEVDDGV